MPFNQNPQVLLYQLVLSASWIITGGNFGWTSWWQQQCLGFTSQMVLRCFTFGSDLTWTSIIVNPEWILSNRTSENEGVFQVSSDWFLEFLWGKGWVSLGLWFLDASITVQWLCVALVAPELAVLCELLAPRTMEIGVEGSVFLFVLQIS